MAGLSGEQITVADPTAHRSPQRDLQTAADPDRPKITANQTPHNIFIYREDGVKMDRTEVQNIQDIILLEQLASTEAAIDVSRTRYLTARRAQLITLTTLPDLDSIIGVVERAIDKNIYNWYAPLRPAKGDLYFTFIRAKLITLIDRGFLQKLILLASSGFKNIRAVKAQDLRDHVMIASPPKFNTERIQIMYRLSPEYISFLQTKNMRLTLSTTVLRMSSASKARELQQAKELEIVATEELEKMNII